MDKEEEAIERGPGEADYDLSEEAGYADWEPRKPFPLGKWLLVGVSALLALALVLPLVLTLLRS